MAPVATSLRQRIGCQARRVYQLSPFIAGTLILLASFTPETTCLGVPLLPAALCLGAGVGIAHTLYRPRPAEAR